MKTYLVGGAVRDKLLGLKVIDNDWVVVGSTPEQMVELGYQPVGKDFPVFINKKSGEEYALARTERKTSRGYQGFSFNTSPDISLEDDLIRRDITINAMAEDKDGTLIDPFNGQQDLKDGIIRHVSDAFIEDPVRVLRVARFAARFNFTIANETQALMSAMVSNGEVDALVAERVWHELHKALLTDNPQIFFQTLRDCGALAKILPEVDNLFGVPQTATYHPEVDTGVHMMLVMQQVANLSDDPVVRFAALMHDLGKARTPEREWPSHKGHEKAGLPLVKQVCKRLRVPKKYQSLALAVTEYHFHMHYMAKLRPETVLKMMRATRCLNDSHRAKQIAHACIADARGRTGFEDAPYPQAQLFLDYNQAISEVDSAAIAAQQSSDKQIVRALDKAYCEAVAKLRPANTDN